MKKKTSFLSTSLVLMGVLLILASSCNKDDDNIETIPVVSTTVGTEITQTTAVSGGNITNDGGATVTARGVCWSTNQNPTISDSKTEDGSGIGSFTSSMSGLAPNTTYYVRAYATNSAGAGYGSSTSFTTQERTTIPVVSTTVVTEITQTTAVSGGNITNDGGATVTTRGVCWSTNQNPTISDSKTEDGTGTGSFTSSISGVAPNTTYYVRAYATNSAGASYGSAMSFTTQERITIPMVSTTAVTEITQTTAVSGGNISNDGGATVTARGVCWSTNQNPTISDSKTVDGTGTGSFTSSMSGLAPNTTYYVKAYATNIEGTGYGSAVSFTTFGNSQFTDSRDGNVYQTVTIGNQVWMVENLKYLPEVYGPGTSSQTTPHYYVYGYDGTNVTDAKATANYSTYGVLYNWSAAMVACPPGWHLPSDAEWTALTNFLGGQNGAGGKLKEDGTAYWKQPNAGATNETGFTALPGGQISSNKFLFIGYNGLWWTTESISPTSARNRMMVSTTGNVTKHSEGKATGFSIRCIRD